jgi:hypothetical protein
MATSFAKSRLASLSISASMLAGVARMVERPTVGRLIKRLRASRGLTQGQLPTLADHDSNSTRIRTALPAQESGKVN